MQQPSLFEPAPHLAQGSLPGLEYAPDFIDAAEEAALLALIPGLPLKEAQYRQYTARRRTVSYGAGYDYSAQRATAAPPLPHFLQHLTAKAAEWAGVEKQAFKQALIAEYQPGTPLGWHRDVPDYEVIVGLSLAGPGRMRFRPYPWRAGLKQEVLAIELAPRSAYILRNEARWKWQHSVPPAKVLRYSITLRTHRAL